MSRVKVNVISTEHTHKKHTHINTPTQTDTCLLAHFVRVSNRVERNGQPPKELPTEERSCVELHPQKPKQILDRPMRIQRQTDRHTHKGECFFTTQVRWLLLHKFVM